MRVWHVCDTFEHGVLHAVRYEFIFFNIGHLFNAALAKDGQAKAVPPKRLGLPKMNQLQEFDVDFRRSTPVRWLLASAIDDASEMETSEKSAMAAADLSNSNEASLVPAGDPSRGTELLGFGMQHGGDALQVCKSSSSSLSKGSCVVGDRWVSAMMRVASAYRESSRGVVRASKARLKKWLAKSFDLQSGGQTEALEEDSHRAPYCWSESKNVLAKGGMRPRVPLSGWIRINQLVFALSRICVTRALNFWMLGRKALPMIWSTMGSCEFGGT